MLFVKEYFRSGGVAAVAARNFGIPRGTVQDWFEQHPAFIEYVNQKRKELADATKYDLRAAMDELNEAIQFAKDTENANAYAKLLELKMKGHGLLIEKHDVRQFSSFSISIAGIDSTPKLPMVDVTPALAPGDISDGQQIDEERLWS